MKFLILIFFLATICIFAQPATPDWLNQIKLSGLSGTVDHPLALINGKTFSEGEANNLKVAGKNVVVKCLEIRDQAVLVRIQDLPSRYELTMTGRILAVDIPPVTQAVATIESPTQFQRSWSDR